MSSTAVVLVHAYTLFRQGLRHYLETVPDFHVVGEASNGQQAIQLVTDVDPELLLIEMDLPGVSGLEVSRVIKRNHPHVGIVLFTSTIDSQGVIKAIRAGVAALLPQNASWDDVLASVREVCAGNYPINNLVTSMPDVAFEVLGAFRQMAMDGDVQQVYSPLSPRELQILELIASEQSNKEIASSLDISNQTVKNHVSSILRKLAVNDRTQAVIYAIRQGWIQKSALPEK